MHQKINSRKISKTIGKQLKAMYERKHTLQAAEKPGKKLKYSTRRRMLFNVERVSIPPKELIASQAFYCGALFPFLLHYSTLEQNCP